MVVLVQRSMTLVFVLGAAAWAQSDRYNPDRKPGTALDVGMGQERNTIYFAQQGWDVTGSMRQMRGFVSEG